MIVQDCREKITEKKGKVAQSWNKSIVVIVTYTHIP